MHDARDKFITHLSIYTNDKYIYTDLHSKISSKKKIYILNKKKFYVYSVGLGHTSSVKEMYKLANNFVSVPH